MDRLFRESGLMRAKWDEVHYADGQTYGEVTVERACRVTSERYEPSGAADTDHSRQSRHRTQPSRVASPESDARAGTTPASDPPADASFAHLRETNAVLRERVREQQAPRRLRQRLQLEQRLVRRRHPRRQRTLSHYPWSSGFGGCSVSGALA
jgi:hypothetical protein